MTTAAKSTVQAANRTSWLPLVVVVLTQIQASFAVNALTVSMAGITTDIDTPSDIPAQLSTGGAKPSTKPKKKA